MKLRLKNSTYGVVKGVHCPDLTSARARLLLDNRLDVKLTNTEQGIQYLLR